MERLPLRERLNQRKHENIIRLRGNGSKLECFEGIDRYYVYEFDFLKIFIIVWSDVNGLKKILLHFGKKCLKQFVTP